jgi:hypothetical protein
VQLVLDPRIRIVRVDGRVVTERPVLVHLAGTPIVVDALGPEGERVRRLVGADAPDRVTVQLPRVEAGGRPGNVPPGGSKSPLLGSPYRRRAP